MTTTENLQTYLVVQQSPDKLAAYIRFNVADENFSCTAEQLAEFLKSHNIKHGLQHDVINQLVKLPSRYFQSQTLIAQGVAPVNGEDGFIRFAYDMNEGEYRPLELEGGKVDFKEVTQLKNVKRGQLIAEKVKATPGKDGIAVTGEAVPCRNGKEAYFKMGKNVLLNPEQTAIYAAIDGLISITDKSKVNVFPVFEVNGDVDYKVGNIDFVGNVVIRGNVLTGFKVKAVGDIRVIGGVEGAILETEGSIEVTGGVLASNKGYLKAGKNIKCSFIQDGNVTAAEDVLVSQSIMHSHVRAGRNVICSGVKGLVVGGTIQAGDRVVARTIGNSMSTATVIEVGVRPELRSELLELRSQNKLLSENLDKTEKALALLDQLAAVGQLPPDRMAMRIKLGSTKRASVEEIAQNKERVLEIEKSLENTDRAKVDAVNVIYGGTKIVIGRNTRFIKDPMQRISFRYADGDIVMAPYI
ncbi:DUF342 domain-containing protein [Paenibacillus rhizovicinus]|uniref:DUF342 domain-containing protein n=1 Tax=Paenibacillus rhizovicinus TaxID=2704463 RepID=A0A6C0NZZ2_9BACL|nr:FapA family protein [Paenibacillus rhizovicinus]QHW30042.1 DUF342 domain-containing protein [Paenibacillus rhizovicinus]